MNSSIIKCFNCNNDYTLENRPWILPCNNTMCNKCINQFIRPVGGFRIPCDCTANHIIKDIRDIYPCELIINYLRCQADHSSLLENLKDQLEHSRFNLNVAKFEAGQHYDAIAMDVEIQSEMLINTIHDKRDQLLEKIRTYRDETETQFELIAQSHDLQCKEVADNISGVLDKVDDVSVDENLHKIMQCSNSIQRSIEEVKSGMFYFSKSTDLLETTCLGVILNKAFDSSFLKIKNLSMNDQKKTGQLTLQPIFDQETLRRYIVPMSQVRTVIIYFTTNRSICLELFNEHGESLKRRSVESRVAYYPIFSNTSDNLVISYLIDNRTKIVIYDSDLNEICSRSLRNSIESIYVGNRNVVCAYVYKAPNCCQIFDLELNDVSSFGQQTNSDEPFYMEKCQVDLKNFKAKLNPIPFGITDSKVYFYNKKGMLVLCRQTGNVLMSLDKKSAGSYYILDCDENFMEVDTQSKEITFKSADLEVSATSRYDKDTTNVTFIDDGFLVLVDALNRKLTIV